MIMERNWPDDYDLLRTLTQRVRNGEINKESSLCFRSTNYDTYIWVEEPDGDHQSEARIGIYTCNNIDWQFPSEVQYDGEDSGYESSHNKTFTAIKSGVTGVRTDDNISAAIKNDTGMNSYDCWCKDCGTDTWYREENQTKQIVCPSCGKIVLTRTKKGKWKKV